MAKEKGFYQNAGLDVKIQEYNKDIDVLDKVINGHTFYGIGRSSLVVDKTNGADVKLLFSAFQSSPSILIATKESGIKSIRDFKNKKIMASPSILNSAEFHAMMNRYEIHLSDLTTIKPTFKIKDLIEKKADLLASYITTQPYLLDKQNIEYTIFDPKDYGFDFYSDILFTSEHEVTYHKQRAIKFRNASLKGWEYAFNNIEESVEIILSKYNTQNRSKEKLLYEAQELKKLAYYKTDKLGSINQAKIQKIYDIYNVMGTITGKETIEDIIFQENSDKLRLNKEEKKWIKENPVVKFSDINWEPFSIVKNQKMEGITRDYLDLISKKTGIEFKYIPSKKWDDVLDKFNSNEIDMFSASQHVLESLNKALLSSVYKVFPMAIITSQKYKYVASLDSFNGKTITLPKNSMSYSYNYIKKNFPDIKILPAKSIKEALLLVENGKAEAFVGHMAVSLANLSKLHLKNLKIAGSPKFDYEHTFLIQENHKVLLSIINKAIDTISFADASKIDSKWTNVTVKQETDYTLFIQMFIIAVIVFFILLYRSKKLNEYNEKLKSSNKIILEKEKTLEDLNKQLEANVNEALKNLKSAHKLAKIGTWKLNLQNNKLVWNDITYKIFKRDEKTNPIKNYERFINTVYSDDRIKLCNAYKAHLKNKLPYFLMHRIVLDNGEIKYVEERGDTKYDENDKPIFSWGTVQDVTEQQLSIIKLKKKDEQMVQQSRLAQMGEMLSMIAHQWRQPLSAISATTNNLMFKVMLDEIDKEVFKTELSLVDGYTQHLSKTIEDFRGFFKKDKKKTITTLEEIIGSTLDIVRKSIENKNIKISTNYEANKKINTYANELKQVVLNLMKNAEDVLVEKEIQNPHIYVNTQCINNKLIVSVKDNGGGVPADIRSNLFDPYFTTKEKREGTGLGLYMSKIIVEDHCGGKLHIKNDEDGAVFSIEFEIAKAINE